MSRSCTSWPIRCRFVAWPTCWSTAASGTTPARIRTFSASLTATTSPVTGEYRSLTALTASTVPKTSRRLNRSPTAGSGTLGNTASAASDDPAWATSNPPPIAYCPSSGAGQANSAAASLVINGLGALGVPGPFSVTIATGGTLTLDWTGPAFQPLVLVAGPVNNAHTVVTGLGTIDVGTPPTFGDVIIVFNGTQPPLSAFFDDVPTILASLT